MFVDATNENFRLSDVTAGEGATSPAIDGGVEQNPEQGPAVDFGTLRGLTTTSNRFPDNGALDLGYHNSPEAEIPPPRDPFLYVRTSGDDRNDGTSPSRPSRPWNAAAQRVGDGDTVIVGPGASPGRLVDPRGGTPDKPVTFLARPSGN